MTPKWQKARMIKAHSSRPQDLGRELWIRCGPPKMMIADVSPAYNVGRGLLPPVLRYETNVTDDIGNTVCRAADVELLPDFAEDVPLISIEDWLKGAAS